MAKPVPKPKQSDHFTLYVVGGALAVVLIGFVVAWFYFQQNPRVESRTAYASFGPLVVSTSAFSLKASVTVQAGNEHASWLDTNKKQFDIALQNALAKTDLELVRKPDGITYLQRMLLDETNRALNTGNVQQILLTDFVIQAE